MNYTLIFHTHVETDVGEVYNWYENKQEWLGERFLGELADCYRDLEAHPQHYSRVSKSYRSTTLKHFPYIIPFEIAQDTVTVYAVFHTSRKQSEIRRRRKSI